MHTKQTNPPRDGFWQRDGFAVNCVCYPGSPPHPTLLFVHFPCPSMSIGFEANLSVVGVNEPVSLTVVARNDSSSLVKSMHVEIVQVCTWYARGHRETKKRAVASVAVSGSQLGEVQHAAEKGHQRGRSAIAVEDAARVYLQELLAAGTGTRYELLVPNDCLFTLKTGLIEVRHLLSVRLKTPTCVNSPEVCMPLRVQARTMVVVMGAPPEANPVGRPTVETVSYATTVGAGSGEEIRPVVSVPQSAVTMEFSSELPQPSAPAKGQYNP